MCTSLPCPGRKEVHAQLWGGTAELGNSACRQWDFGNRYLQTLSSGRHQPQEFLSVVSNSMGKGTTGLH